MMQYRAHRLSNYILDHRCSKAYTHTPGHHEKYNVDKLRVTIYHCLYSKHVRSNWDEKKLNSLTGPASVKVQMTLL